MTTKFTRIFPLPSWSTNHCFSSCFILWISFHLSVSSSYADSSLLWFLLCRSFPKFLPSTHFAPQYFSFSNFNCTQDFSYALYGNHPNVYLHNRCLQNYKCHCSSGSPLHCLTTNLNQQNCKWLTSSSISWTTFPRSLGMPRQSSDFIYFRYLAQNFSKAALMGKNTLISV